MANVVEQPGNYPENFQRLINSGEPVGNFLFPSTILAHDLLIWAMDIRGFTESMEKDDPEKVNNFVAYFFERASSDIVSSGGVIAKFLGDGLFAYAISPEEKILPKSIVNAVRLFLRFEDAKKEEPYTLLRFLERPISVCFFIVATHN